MIKKSIFKGIFFTSIASIFWGMPQPIFFYQIKFIPAIEIISHRSIWSFITLFILILVFKKFEEVKNIFKDKIKLSYLLFSGVLITANWSGFILAISIDRLQDASMGYYISPILFIALASFFLKEKLSKFKILSILLILLSLIYLLISMKTIPYLAVLIAFTWSFYGLIRKKINVSSEIGLFVESGFISIFAFIYLSFIYISSNSYFLGKDHTISIFLILTGPITVFPLFFFNLGVKNIQLGLAGIIFYLAPTFHFITSIFIFGESFNYNKLISFIIIWFAVGIFIYDNLKEKKINENNTQLLN